MLRLGFVLSGLLLSCNTTQVSKIRSIDKSPSTEGVLLSGKDPQNQLYRAVGFFKGKLNCTAFLWNSRTHAVGPATVITNGHCVQDFASKATAFEVITNQILDRPMAVSFPFFFDQIEETTVYNGKKIVYASMNAVDIAIVELDVTWEQLEQVGLRPLTLASEPAIVGAPLKVIGIPLGGIDPSEQYLRQMLCKQEGKVDLVEWHWHWFDSQRNNCANIVKGNSGSPVLNNLGQVVSLLNTTSVGAISESCYMGNPCEVQSDKTALVPNKSYAVGLERLPKCFDGEGLLRFTQDCFLPRPEILAVTNAPSNPTAPIDRQGQPLLWKTSITSPQFRQMQWKFGPLFKTNCRDLEGYTEPQSLDQGILNGTPIPTENGIYGLCLLGSTADIPADSRFANVYILNVDTISPSLKPLLNVNTGSVYTRVDPIFAVPELSDYSLAHGPIVGPTCEALTYFTYRRIPVILKNSDLPLRFCVQGKDHVGNKGPIFEYPLAKASR
jgi:V8-like Glu-specific endopeptidase